jgi:hypothetical protein
LEISAAFSRLCPFFICNSFHLHSPKGLRGQLDVHCCVEPSPSDLGTRGVVNLAGRQQDSTATTILFPKPVRHFHSGWAVGMAYHCADNILSCLGCVTDWQQETRSCVYQTAPEGWPWRP